MINIAIVEDELQEARLIAGYLKKFAAANRLQISVKAYSNAESFLTEDARAFRLVFFDIRLPGIDGLTAALKFREKIPTPSSSSSRTWCNSPSAATRSTRATIY